MTFQWCFTEIYFEEASTRTQIFKNWIAAEIILQIPPLKLLFSIWSKLLQLIEGFMNFAVCFNERKFRLPSSKNLSMPRISKTYSWGLLERLQKAVTVLHVAFSNYTPIPSFPHISYHHLSLSAAFRAFRVLKRVFIFLAVAPPQSTYDFKLATCG